MEYSKKYLSTSCKQQIIELKILKTETIEKNCEKYKNTFINIFVRN